ncbi:hypothetical protein H920_04743 [Fukomys damarensis]|uniref:Uncharacterized protein n=1 Tax=Fukomys damarensis TaxID=885580 RepID=A0A091DNR0_FUKDA|nr:hypothetical protein H920_04743 [Fukomys damarensis]
MNVRDSESLPLGDYTLARKKLWAHHDKHREAQDIVSSDHSASRHFVDPVSFMRGSPETQSGLQEDDEL